MITGKTASGFEFSLKESTLDDMELLDALASVAGDDFTALPMICEKILGDQKKRLYDHVRSEEGNVPIQAVSDELIAIINAAGKAGKNS